MSLCVLCQAIWQGCECPFTRHVVPPYPRHKPGRKPWGCPSFPWCPRADTIHMPSVAQQFLLFLCAWHAGSECQRGVTLRKRNRWELILCFPAKYPAKRIWLILCAGMSRTLWRYQKYRTKLQQHCKFVRWAVALTGLNVLNSCPFLTIWLRLAFNEIGKKPTHIKNTWKSADMWWLCIWAHLYNKMQC